MPHRRYIAANWKMNKTVAEAAAVRRRAAAADRRDPARRRHLPALHGADRGGRAPLRHRGQGRRPEHARGGVAAPSPARSRRRCWSSSTSRRSSSATPSAASSSARPTRRWPARCRRRSPPAWSRSSASARARRRATPARPRRCWSASSQADLAEVEAADLAEVVIAYEPIWAIGTGRTATPEQAQEAMRLHPRRAARSAAPRPTRCGSSTAARSSPTTPPSCSAQPDIDGALVGGASLDPEDFAAIVDAADERRMATPVPSLALVILDGWGLAEPGPGNAISLAETPVFDRLWERFPHTQLSAQGRDVGLPDGPDGQLRGRPPQPRRRRDRQAGPGPDRRRDRRRQLLRERGAARRLRARPPQPARPPAPARPGLRRRRPLRLGAHRGGDRAGLPGGRARRRLPRLHRRPRHAARTAAAATSPSWSAGCARRAASAPSAAATTRWTATPAGSGPSSPTTRSSTPRACSAASAAEAIEAAYERGETDEFVKPTVIGDYDGVADGRRRDLRQLPPRPGPADDPRPRRARTSTSSRAPAAPLARPDDDDRVPQGLALPGRLPRGSGRRRPWPR